MVVPKGKEVKVALCGPMASGKTWLAEKLVEDYDLTRINLAGKVKDIAADLFFMQPENKDRVLLQEIGKKMRDIRPSVWVDYLLHEADHIGQVVCDDVRFINEAQRLQADGFTIILLEISEDLQKERLQRTYLDNWEVHWNARRDASELDMWGEEILEYIDGTISVQDGEITYQKLINMLKTLDVIE
jgi:adenylate kinase family enzyme